jgi:DNA invertase Pin-like site-specific DNA recombinase
LSADNQAFTKLFPIDLDNHTPLRHIDARMYVSKGGAMNRKYFSYLRVSTDKQGERGYGLDAQRKAISDYLAGRELLGEYVEIESGKHNDRPQLAAALSACKRNKATLIIAKLDRLSRNVAFIAALMDGTTDFVCCDFPQANRLTLHILAAVAEHEREAISARTKAGLAAAKARGVRLGSDTIAAQNAAAAAMRDAELRPVLESMQGLSSRAIAERLTERGIEPPRGGAWSQKTVLRMIERLGL